MFTKILNNRLVEWAENHNLQKEEQAGYRKKYSTIDQIFSLQALWQKYIAKKEGRFYVLFIDFTKAFDFIHHYLVWFELIKSSVNAKIAKSFKLYVCKFNILCKDTLKINRVFSMYFRYTTGMYVKPFSFFTIHVYTWTCRYDEKWRFLRCICGWAESKNIDVYLCRRYCLWYGHCVSKAKKYEMCWENIVKNWV